MANLDERMARDTLLRRRHDLGAGWYAQFDKGNLVVYSESTAVNLKPDSVERLRNILNGAK